MGKSDQVVRDASVPGALLQWRVGRQKQGGRGAHTCALQMVKDHRTGVEQGQVGSVLEDGQLRAFHEAELRRVALLGAREREA